MGIKIIIGITEIANFINDYAIALRTVGYEVDTIVYGINKYYDKNRYSYKIRENVPNCFSHIKYVRGAIKKLWYYIQSSIYFICFVFRYHQFIYVWKTSYLPFHLDLFILRLLGKKVIILHCGSDVRFRPIQYKVGKQLGQNDILRNISLEKRKKYFDEGACFRDTFFYQKVSEWSGAIVLSQRNQATFGRNYHFARFPICRLINTPRRTNDVVKIVHAPTNSIFKRSDIVKGAIDILNKRCPQLFEFELIEGKSNSYVLDILKRTDIVIDQPSDWIGHLGGEALAAGCVVLGGNNISYEEGAPMDSPVIQFIADAESLANKLQYIIEHKEVRQSIMEQSYYFWEKYYSFDAFNMWFDNLLKKQISLISSNVNYKRLLLRAAENNMQKNVINVFY